MGEEATANEAACKAEGGGEGEPEGEKDSPGKAISGNHLGSTHTHVPLTLDGNQWQSVAISDNQWQSVAISGDQWQSVAITWEARTRMCPSPSSSSAVSWLSESCGQEARGEARSVVQQSREGAGVARRNALGTFTGAAG